MFEISVSARASLNGEEQWRRLQELRPMGGLTAIPAAISVTVVVAVAATVTAAGEKLSHAKDIPVWITGGAVVTMSTTTSTRRPSDSE